MKHIAPSQEGYIYIYIYPPKNRTPTGLNAASDQPPQTSNESATDLNRSRRSDQGVTKTTEAAAPTKGQPKKSLMAGMPRAMQCLRGTSELDCTVWVPTRAAARVDAGRPARVSLQGAVHGASNYL